MNSNSTSDMEMVDADASTAVAMSSDAASAARNDAVRDQLTRARQLVDQGQPTQALQAIVIAMKIRGGDDAVYQNLQRARDLYRNKLQASADADQLASLFAECAIAEAQPATTRAEGTAAVASSSPSLAPTVPAPEIEPDVVYGKSILAETGRKQIVLDVFADGSSFVCLECGGLVSVRRRNEHYAYWCQL
ncbi:hypothetical protein Dimus_004534 [Dionaea muscipula]